ncbi:hypothetical protein OF83DRAFT_1106284 [Amylostereum chailletii]|nr:hypothetical protein OF83DRAFT_1106284 [Amylostereum chailletii]
MAESSWAFAQPDEPGSSTPITTQTEPDAPMPAPDKPKRKAKPPTALVREGGKSLLPFSRVQKILKADKELPMVAKEATFLISIATEEFIKRLAEASHRVAGREKRVTVQQKDVASVVRKADEFLFLEEIIPWPDPTDVPTRRKPGGQRKVDIAATSDGTSTMLDHFVTAKSAGSGDQGVEVIMNEDGTMQMAGGDAEDSDSQ